MGKAAKRKQHRKELRALGLSPTPKPAARNVVIKSRNKGKTVTTENAFRRQFGLPPFDPDGTITIRTGASMGKTTSLLPPWTVTK